MTDRIDKTIDIAAPVARVWRALTDHVEFGQWFGVRLDGPFAAGQESTGLITYPGYEHLKWTAKVVVMDEPRRFAFTWHPYAVDPERDYSGEEPTLVEFLLEETASGTRLRTSESGFDKIPAARRDEALRMNDGGWDEQARNIKAHAEG